MTMGAISHEEDTRPPTRSNGRRGGMDAKFTALESISHAPVRNQCGAATAASDRENGAISTIGACALTASVTNLAAFGYHTC
jgi:hypothetical protein